MLFPRGFNLSRFDALLQPCVFDALSLTFDSASEPRRGSGTPLPIVPLDKV
jgi:hypothetical protein